MPIRQSLFNFCKTHSLAILCLYEPKIGFANISPCFWHSLKLSFLAHNDINLPSIWILVSDNLGASNVSLLSSSDQ